MNSTTTPASEPILKNLGRLLPDLETLYKDLHSHPELSMQETRTAGLGRRLASQARLRGDNRRWKDRGSGSAP